LRPGIAGMLARLRLFPLHSLTARTGIARRLHAARTRKSDAILTARGHDRLLAGRHPDAMPQDSADLVYLYDVVSRHRPARAIEFGSGQSTILIAQALHDTGSGHLWSLDAEAGWLAHTGCALPAHLKPFVTFVHSAATVHFDHGVAAFRYSVVPPGPWDFVLIDGPALTADVTLSSDLAELSLALGAVGMIDHRWRSAVLAAERAGDRLRLRYMPSLESFAVRAG
jgi:predicted O-methyltransferase YrrM